jgi:hypothetical protein
MADDARKTDEAGDSCSKQKEKDREKERDREKESSSSSDENELDDMPEEMLRMMLQMKLNKEEAKKEHPKVSYNKTNSLCRFEYCKGVRNGTEQLLGFR